MEKKSNIKIIFSHTYKIPGSSEGSTGFWAPFVYRAVQEREKRNSSYNAEYVVTENLFEGRVRNHFGRKLKESLSEISASNARYNNEPRFQLSNAIIFTVEDISYGSLDISLIAEPIEKAIKFFENNFDYFDTFLRTYALPALSDSIYFGSNGPYFANYSDIIDQLKVDVILDPGLIKRLEAKQDNANASESNSKQLTNKANWLWVVSNTSLIIPVIIACVIIYFAFGRLQGREKEIDLKHNELYQRQTELINSLMKNRTTNLPEDSAK